MRWTLLIGLVPLSVWLIVTLSQIGHTSAEMCLQEEAEDVPAPPPRRHGVSRIFSAERREQKLLKKQERLNRKLQLIEDKLAALRGENGRGEGGPVGGGGGAAVSPGGNDNAEPPGMLRGNRVRYVGRRRGNSRIKFPLAMNIGRAWNTGGKDWSSPMFRRKGTTFG